MLERKDFIELDYFIQLMLISTMWLILKCQKGLRTCDTIKNIHRNFAQKVFKGALELLSKLCSPQLGS